MFLSKRCFSLLFFVFWATSILALSQPERSFVKIIRTDSSGLTIQLNSPAFSFSKKEIDGRSFDVVSHEDASFTSEPGKPLVPYFPIFVGVPPQALLTLNVIDSKFSDLHNYFLLPAPNYSPTRSKEGIEYLSGEYKLDADFYSRSTFYPPTNATISNQGYIRSQRVACVSLYPIQYNPANRVLRIYSYLLIRINFSQIGLSPPAFETVSYNDVYFEDLYKGILLNYADAKPWRISSGIDLTRLAPRAKRLGSSQGSVKIFVSRSGIYRVDHALLQSIGIDLSKIDPVNMKLYFNGSQVPIYVKGEGDHKFDPEDYIEFYSGRVHNIYTRWNVYWLTWDEEPGIRVAQKNGVPTAKSPREVTFFKSIVRFEEDLLHHKLQNVRPDPNDPYSWFESRDHWFWTGIENGSEKNQVTVKFPVYDLAQTMSKPDFKIELVGCTNYEHNIMISVNGFRVGPEAQWSSQEIYLFDGQLPVGAINDGFDNELRIARIGTNPADGNDLDSYPYQVYLNWFEIGYYRKLIAVNDQLEFSAPEPKEKSPIFTTDLSPKDALDMGKITQGLKLKFSSKRIDLSENAYVSIQEKGNKWLIVDGKHTYLIVRSGNNLNAFVNEVNNYTISGFLNKDIEIFQISDTGAIARIKDPVINQYKLSAEEKDRLRAIFRNSISNVDEFNFPRIPDIAYSVTFEDDDVPGFKYIAVTSSSVLRPDRVEVDNSSNLKDPSNRADYIIISHPIYLKSAQRLSEWRSSPNGGGFKTMVVDVTDIYDEFGNGMVSPHAVKDFLKYAYNNWMKPAPSYVLIFADSTYDFLGINKKFYSEAPELIGFIPTFYIWTNFGQTAADHWYSTICGDDSFPDLYLGRIPVEDVSQAEDVVDKIIANESKRFNGQWRKQIVSIADDDSYAAGDEQFQIGLEEVWKWHTPAGYETKKIYLKDIIKEFESGPKTALTPADIAKDLIIDAFGNGAVIVQYSGHGGRHVWAHEIIFSITDIKDMRKTDIYPFLMVFSCYNGYFDLPGEICMAEGMLRAKSSGSVAMLSATRLTYGTGNVSLNKLIFDCIFRDKMRRLGQITATSKIKLLIQDGLSWIGQMEQYTLFGDPASELQIPEFEAEVKLQKMSVSTKVEVLPGRVFNSSDNREVNYDGNATFTVHYPDGRSETKSVYISNGTYPAISFEVPSNMSPGKGRVTVFGQAGSEALCGGIEFNVRQPLITNLTHEILDGRFQVYVKIDDDIGQENLSSVILYWATERSPSFVSARMTFQRQSNSYVLDQPIQIPAQANQIIYYVVVQDKDGITVNSGQQIAKLSDKFNLSIYNPSTDASPPLRYAFSKDDNSFGFYANLLKSDKEQIKKEVTVAIFDGNPDKDGDKLIDKDAKKLGESKVNQSDWSILPGRDSQIASCFIKCQLPLGQHVVTLWIDPNSETLPFGEYEEFNENDNMFSTTISASHELLSPSRGVILRSVDNIFSVNISQGAVNQDTPIVIEPRSTPIPVGQPDVTPMPFPLEGSASKSASTLAYSVINDNVTFGKFLAPILIQVRFSITSFRNILKAELGFGEISDEQMNAEQREILNRAIKDRVNTLGIYVWLDQLKKWKKLPSKPILNSEGNILSKVTAVTHGPINTDKGAITAISIDPQASTPIDDWTVRFIDSKSFSVIGNKTGIIAQTHSIDAEFYDSFTGIRFRIKEGINGFRQGDELTFKTIETGTIEASSEFYGIFALMMSKDDHPPFLQVNIDNQAFDDGDIISSEPKINVIISDRNGVDPYEISMSQSVDGEDFRPVDSADYVVKPIQETGEVLINYSPKKLEPGNYELMVTGRDLNGNVGVKITKFRVKKEFEIVKDTLMNYPNPFEKDTYITFQLTSLADDVVIKIYTVSGRLIRTLEESRAVNFVMIYWDGKDEEGNEVANGVYYYKVTLKQRGKKDIVRIGKMMKLK